MSSPAPDQLILAPPRVGRNVIAVLVALILLVLGILLVRSGLSADDDSSGHSRLSVGMILILAAVIVVVALYARLATVRARLILNEQRLTYEPHGVPHGVPEPRSVDLAEIAACELSMRQRSPFSDAPRDYDAVWLEHADYGLWLELARADHTAIVTWALPPCKALRVHDFLTAHGLRCAYLTPGLGSETYDDNEL